MLSAPPRSSAENVRFTATRTEMDSCRVVGPRDLCRPLDSPLAPCQGCSKAGQACVRFPCFRFQKRTGPGICQPWAPAPPKARSAGPQTPLGYPPDPSSTPMVVFGVILYWLTVRGGVTTVLVTLPHCSDGTLGRGPRSGPRTAMQMVSGG